MNIPLLSKWLASRGKRREREEAYRDWPDSSLAIASAECIGPERTPVRFMRRDEPRFRQDSGWSLFSGSESDAFADDPSNFKPVLLSRYVELDPSLASVVAQPVGTEWTRKPPEDWWYQIISDKVVDSSGHVVGAVPKSG
jgi:hypothetical protein